MKLNVSAVKEKLMAGKARFLLLMGMILLVGSSTAAEINWTEISSILDGVATNLFPSLVTLITAAVPIIIIVSIVGFLAGFLDKILGLLKM